MLIQQPAPWDTKAFTECDQFPPSLCEAFHEHDVAKGIFDAADARLKRELRAYADANRLPFVRPEVVKSQIERAQTRHDNSRLQGGY